MMDADETFEKTGGNLTPALGACMKRLIGFTAVLCLVAAMVGCGGAIHSGSLAYVSNSGVSSSTGFTVFDVNTDGTLTASTISPVTAPAPKVIQFAANKKWAYFLDATGANIYAYESSGNGQLPLQIGVYPLNAPGTALVINPTSSFLYVTIAGNLPSTQQLITYLIQNDGSLSARGSQFTPYISQLLMSPSGGVLYGLSPSGNIPGDIAAVVSWTLNASSGVATSAIGTNPLPVGTSPDYMIQSANGNFLYVLDNQQTSLYPNLSCVGLPICPAGLSPNFYGFTTASTGILSPMGGTASGVFNENADLITGKFPTNPVAGAISSDGRFLFIVNQGTANVSAFTLNATTGEPTEVPGTLVTVVTNSGSTQSSTQSPFDCGIGTTTATSCTAPSFAAIAPANNALYVLQEGNSLAIPPVSSGLFQLAIDGNTGRLRDLSPVSPALTAGTLNVPTWITIK